MELVSFFAFVCVIGLNGPDVVLKLHECVTTLPQCYILLICIVNDRIVLLIIGHELHECRYVTHAFHGRYLAHHGNNSCHNQILSKWLHIIQI